MLSDEAKAVLKFIVNRIKNEKVKRDRPETFLSYMEIHDGLALPMLGNTYGMSLIHQGLGELAEYVKRNNLPAITSLVVSQGQFVPGGDFFRFYKQKEDAVDWWLTETRRSIEYDWSSLLGDQETDKVESVEAIYPDELSNTQTYVEGAKKTVQVNAYERNRKARLECIRHYGFDCSVCGMNFEKVYGGIGKHYIHVHHIVSIADVGEEYEVDPVRDLRPVCPNCHAMLHSANPALKPEQLREKMRDV